MLRDQHRSEGDSIDLHLEDTIRAGGGLVDPDAARAILEEGHDLIQDLQPAANLTKAAAALPSPAKAATVRNVFYMPTATAPAAKWSAP